MADWYVSSAAWTTIAQFAISGVYTVGNIVRPLTAPAVNAQYVFRCTTAGTASTEPAWPAGNNATVTTGGATFTNVSGQSAYGWSAAVGDLHTMLAAGNPLRVAAGDRCFLSSDHSEAIAAGFTWNLNGGTAAFGVSQFISVNRAGSVPPVAADAQSGAVVGTGVSAANITIDPWCGAYWQGITVNSSASMTLGNTGTKRHYFKNCTLALTGTGSQRVIQTGCAIGLTLDNTSLQIAFTGDFVQIALMDFIWINTPSAVGGAGIPTVFFFDAGSNTAGTLTARGVDLSAITGSLLGLNAGFGKILLDSCRIASGLNRSIASSSTNSGEDEVELVNCYDGTHFIAERHTPAGDLTTEFTITLSGGATDNVGTFSHKMVSSSRSDKYSMPLEGFWLDTNYATTGSAKTATVEIVSSASLNNDDITLLLEYEGTASSSLASFVSSFPNPLTTPSAVASSSATWNSLPATPVRQHLQATFTPQTAGRVRARVQLGKPSTTVYVDPRVVIT